MSPEGGQITIRLVGVDDAARLIAIRSSVIEHDLDTDEFVHHLGIAQGEDYFCLVAECDGSIVGYLSAGGSRDDDHKSYGEFYELAADPAAAGAPVLDELATAGWTMLVNAEYGGVIARVGTDSTEPAQTVRELGFVPDEREREHRAGQVRLGRVIPPPARRER